MKVSQIRDHKKIVRGGSLNIFGALRDFGNWSQGAIDKIAPYTAKIAGPVADALTGMPLSSLAGAASTLVAQTPADTNATTVAAVVNSPAPQKQAAIPANIDVNAILKKVMGKGLSLA